MKAAVDAYLAHGSISAGARAIGIGRQAFGRRLDAAKREGLADAPTRAEANPSRWRPFAEVVEARKKEFGRVKAAGDGRKLHLRPLRDEGPFMRIALGDPHLDSPGTDLDLFERWSTRVVERAKGLGLAGSVGFLGLGDWLDNWPRFLSFIYGSSETPAPEAWILFEGYLDALAEMFEASCSGNHDDWSGYTDLLGYMMRQRGILHRATSLRVGFETPSGRVVSFGMRHRFSGNSQWNPAHAVMKAAAFGWRDTVLVGGDKHISGAGRVRDPDTGRLTWCYQVAAFKVADDYGDALGLMDKHITPAVAFVVDPRRADDDPQLVTPFDEPEEALDYLAFKRRRFEANSK